MPVLPKRVICTYRSLNSWWAHYWFQKRRKRTKWFWFFDLQVIKRHCLSPSFWSSGIIDMMATTVYTPCPKHISPWWSSSNHSIIKNHIHRVLRAWESCTFNDHILIVIYLRPNIHHWELSMLPWLDIFFLFFSF